MDFIAIDLDKYDVWETFRQPVPIKAQMYQKDIKQNHQKFAAMECIQRWNGEEICIATDGQSRHTNQSRGGGSGSNPRGGPAPSTGATAPSGGATSSDSPTVQSRRACRVEQGDERQRDAATARAVSQINRLDPDIEHANFVVNLNGVPTPLTPVSGDENFVSTRGLFDQLNALGLNESHILVDIHSHPGTLNLTDPSAISQDTFVNSFPSAADYAAVETYVSTAIFFGANESEWRENFAHVVISPDDIAREFENFSQPSDEDFPNNGVPETGTDERNALDERLENARNDAEGQCNE